MASGEAFHRAYLRATQQALLEAHELAFRHLDGQTLRHRIETSPLETSEITEPGIQITTRWNAAQAKRIIHRDIKPANIFITGQSVSA